MGTKQVLSYGLVMLLIGLLFACNGGGGDSSGAGSSGTTVSGVASKGLISGGTVEVYAITDDGQKGSLLATTTTDSDGNYTIEAEIDGPILIEVSGGTYTDEATGQEIQLSGTLRAVVPSSSEEKTVAVTPLTELATRIAETTGKMDDTSIESANNYISQLIGVDIIETLPTNCNDADEFGAADASAQNYALFLAALSQMAESGNQDISDIIDEFEDDLSDASLDSVADDLLAALDDFIDSDQNQTGVDDASDLAAIVEDVVDNGFEVAYAISSAWLQYRTYGNADNNAYRFCFAVTKNGLPIEAEEIDTLTITDEDGNQLDILSSGFYSGAYYNYDRTGTSDTLSVAVKDSIVSGRLETIPAGTCQVEIVMANGDTLTKSIPYSGQLVLPAIDSATMQSEWSDDDLVLTWTNPTEEDNWSRVDILRVVLLDADEKELLNINLDATAQTVTIPASVIETISSLRSTGVTSWLIQAKAYDENEMNYARSVSNPVPTFYSIGYTFLQYRTFEDGGSSYPYRLWMQVYTNGESAEDGDFYNLTIYDSDGNDVTPASPPGFEVDDLDYPVCDCLSGTCSWSASGADNGFFAKFSDLPADDYTLTVDCADGTLATRIDFPGAVALPVIASSSVTVHDTADDEDGKVTWTNPTDEDNWSEVDEIRLFFSDSDGNTVLMVKVSPDAESVTIPIDAINEAEALTSGDITTLQIQTRAYDENNMQYARGVSSDVTFDD